MDNRGIAFGMTTDRGDDRSDSEFLQSVRWRKSADPQLVAAALAGDSVAFCKALRASFTEACRSGLKLPTGVLPTLLQPLWSRHAWDDPATSTRLGELLLELQHRQPKQRIKPSRRVSQLVLDGLEAASADESPWSLVVWQTVLLSTAGQLDDRSLMRLWRESLAAATTHTVAGETPAVNEPDFADDRQLLLTGELPFSSGIVFSPVKGSRKWQQQGRRELRAQLELLTDSDGTPHARALHRLPLTLAVFTRSVALGRICGETLFNKSSSERFRELIVRAAVMTHADGRLALSNGDSFATGSLLKSASRLAGLRPKHAARRRLSGLPDDTPSSRTSSRPAGSHRPKGKLKRSGKVKPLPSTQSDWAALACMRNNWSDGGDCCIIAHHDVMPQLSVTGFERLLIDGAWRLDVEVDGRPADLATDWECVCWFSDDDADYVELQQEVPGGITLLRQVLLSRTDHWLWLADNAKLAAEANAGDVALRLRSTIPLAGSPKVKENRWTRELALRTDRFAWKAYPLGLAEERVHKTTGSLSIAGGGLILEQTSAGPGVHMPLLLDWSPDRRRDASQWRQLTVAEDGRRLPGSVASGQRLRIGRHQWLFYRSHQPGETGRSVLGHHTPHETVVAEFTTDGEVEPIVLVE